MEAFKQIDEHLKQAEDNQPCHTCKEEIAAYRIALREGDRRKISQISNRVDIALLGSQMAKVGAIFMIREPPIFREYLDKNREKLHKVQDSLEQASRLST